LIQGVDLGRATTNVNLRKVRVSDVGELLELVNSCSRSDLVVPRGPKYFYENIRDFLVVEVVGENGEPEIVACGSLHVLWEDIAEIRALAMLPRFHNSSMRKRIVQHLIEEARQMGIGQVFILTSETEHFQKLGFEPKTREELPFKLWGECMRCPRYFSCDETGLVFETGAGSAE